MTSIWTGRRYASSPEYLAEKSALTFEQACEPDFHGGSLVERIHPVPGRDAEPCVSSGYGLWSEKIYHFKPDKPPSSDGDEIQSEFFVEYQHLQDAVRDLYTYRDDFAHLVQITEIRAVEQDSIPLSPAQGAQVFGIHFTWVKDFDGVFHAARDVQEILAKYDYRVHWGKFFHPRPDFGDFATFEDDLPTLRSLIETKSTEKFQNCFSQRLLYGNDNCQFPSNYERYAARQNANAPERKAKILPDAVDTHSEL